MLEAAEQETDGQTQAPLFGVRDGARVSYAVGAGWNREVVDRRSVRPRSRVLHAECHAVADCIRRHGEAVALRLLRRATAWIVELKDDVGYEDAPPCRKCACLFRALGVRAARHSTREGVLRDLGLPAQKAELLRVGMACRPLSYALDEMGVKCETLERALEQEVARHTDLHCTDDTVAGLD